MAEVAPFRGLRYDPEREPDLARVFTPPYDVISPEDQELYHGLSSFNMVRLELGKPRPEDDDRNNWCTRAGSYLVEWQEKGELIREENPAIYYYEHDYSLPSQEKQTRYGFICALRLEDFSTWIVRPHEKTFPKVKKTRELFGARLKSR